MVGKELLDRVRRFDRVSTGFHFGLSAKLHPHTPLPISPSTERGAATLADPFLISLPHSPPLFYFFYHITSKNTFVR